MGERLAIDDDTPVLVGVGTADQRSDEVAGTAEAIELMARAVDAAADDAGAAGLLDRLDWVGVPEGTWGYRDPGRLLGSACGRPDVHTVLADVGILQQTLLDAACRAVRGGARVALVAGGEAKHRALRAAITGVDAPETAQPEDVRPDEHLRPAMLGVLDLEIVRNTVAPVTAYALLEHAIGHHAGRSADEHRRAVADLWAGYAAVAADNPRAWDRSGWSAAQIREPSTANRMIATPYTKRHCAQWNVDQAAALLLCTASTASALGVPRDRWVFPHASATSDHAVPVAERRDLHRCPAADTVAGAVLATAGVGIDDVAHLDLYGCFPSAVELYAGALGLAVTGDRPLTVTGGLAFAGGPLNNYVLGALVTLAERLRDDPGSLGLSTSVSGFLVKQGMSVWGSAPPDRGLRVQDVSAQAAATTPTCAVVGDPAGPGGAEGGDGPGRVASWTVAHEGGVPVRVVALVDRLDGTRTIAESSEPELVGTWVEGDRVGTAVRVLDGALVIDG